MRGCQIMAKTKQEVFLDELMRHKEIFIEDGDIQEIAARNIVKRLLLLDTGEEINVYINSGGGVFSDGFTIYDAIRSCRSPVYGTVVGKAASMAVLILQACHRRLARENSTISFHSLILEIKGEWDLFMAHASQKVKEAAQAQERMDTAISARSNLSVIEVKRFCAEKRVFTAVEALRLGLIDEIV